jgi:hypothetical protein
LHAIEVSDAQAIKHLATPGGCASFDKSLTALEPVCAESLERVAAKVWAPWKDLFEERLADFFAAGHESSRAGPIGSPTKRSSH